MNPGPTHAAAAPPAAADEVEVWWGSYSPRSMLPLFAVALAASASLVIALVMLVGLGLRASAARWTAYLTLPPLWLALALWCGYRMATYSYRLTTRRLFLDRGFLHPRAPAVDLARVAAVTVRQTALERRLGVGRVVVQEKDNPVPLVLESVRKPERMAAKVRDQEIPLQSPAAHAARPPAGGPPGEKA